MEKEEGTNEKDEKGGNILPGVANHADSFALSLTVEES